VWLPTWRTVVVCVLVAVAVSYFAITRLHVFLSVTSPTPGARWMVVEGWLSDDALERVARFVNDEAGPYEFAFVTGTDIDRGSYLSAHATNYADLAVATLVALGVPAGRLVPVPAGDARVERTRACARALGAELDRRGLDAAALDLYTEGAHARRSRAVFADELGASRTLGVVALPPNGYDAEHWFASSAGVKTTLVELIGWMAEVL